MSLIRDPNSYGNIDEAQTTHIHLSLAACFESNSLSGTCTHTMKLLRDEVSRVVFDAKQMDVLAVRVNGTAVTDFTLGDAHEAFGRELTIPVAEELRGRGKKVSVEIDYRTHRDASALQWLTAEQTTGGKHPYLFTQCEAIHARAFFPCQDTPAVKTTYTADISVPRGLTALMSATGKGSEDTTVDIPVAANDDGSKVSKLSKEVTKFSFERDLPVPTYLFALVIGNLESRRIGEKKRVLVWSEPEVVDKAAWEFADTEKFIEAFESFVGPNPWPDPFTLLVAPASFNFGGMENEGLVIVTPTLLAGDRSLANVVAHELAHSMTGNCVTNKYWGSFWLNEGFTVLLERKIIARVAGGDEKAVFDFEASIGWADFKDSVAEFGENHQFTCLQTHLADCDPDDAFSSVPYEKGFTFLCYLENLVGGREVFEPFLMEYFKTFKHRSLDTNEFRAFFQGYFAAKGADTSAVDWDAWFYTPGMPIVNIDRDTTLADGAEKLRINWVEKNGEGATAEDIASFSARQTVMFLEKLLTHCPHPHDRIDALDAAYKLSDSRNAEIRFRWQTIRIRSKDERVFGDVAVFLEEQGRMKFVRPLFRDLITTPEGKALAEKIFEKMRNRYHPVCTKMVAKDMGITL